MALSSSLLAYIFMELIALHLLLVAIPQPMQDIAGMAAPQPHVMSSRALLGISSVLPFIPNPRVAAGLAPHPRCSDCGNWHLERKGALLVDF